MANMKYAFELKNPDELEQILALPTLHILVTTDETGITKGHCLDFDTWAFSEDPKNGVEKVTLRLLEMAFLEFFQLFQSKNLSQLYQNQVKDGAIWEEYTSLMNGVRIFQLQNTMKDFFENPEKSLQVLEDKKTTKSPSQETFDMSALSNIERDQMKHWIRESLTATPERRKEIMHHMVLSLGRINKLKLAS